MFWVCWGVWSVELRAEDTRPAQPSAEVQGPEAQSPDAQSPEAQPTACESIPLTTLNEPSGSYEPYDGYVISNIQFKGVEVFNPNDPKENNAVYRFMNKLHINTKESVVRGQLLFQEGDRLNVETVAESARLLRSLPYLGFAAIHLTEICEDGVTLLVVTRDVWTTEPLLNVSREGGDTQRGFGFKEGNVLGRGASISLLYDKTNERSRMQYDFKSPHLFSSRFQMHIGFADNSDGQETAFSLSRPFYSLDSRWATGLSNVDTTQVEKILLADERINAYKHQQERHQIFIGGGVHFKDVHRVTVGMNQDRDVYEPIEDTEMGVPLDSNFIYPWIQYRYLQNRFGVYKNLDSLHRVEDVQLGADVVLMLGYGGEMQGNDVDVMRFRFRYDDILGIGDHHILKWESLAEGYHSPSDSNYSHSVWGAGLRYYILDGERHRYFAHVQYHQGHNLLQHEQLTAGGEFGLRGYPLDYHRGDKRLLLTLENRYVTPWHIFNLFRIGAVGFVDVGEAWGAGSEDPKILANVGFGLRFSSSKAKLDHIAHLDFATPLVDRDLVDDFQFVMKVESHF